MSRRNTRRTGRRTARRSKIDKERSTRKRRVGRGRKGHMAHGGGEEAISGGESLTDEELTKFAAVALLLNKWGYGDFKILLGLAIDKELPTTSLPQGLDGDLDEVRKPSLDVVERGQGLVVDAHKAQQKRKEKEKRELKDDPSALPPLEPLPIRQLSGILGGQERMEASLKSLEDMLSSLLRIVQDDGAGHEFPSLNTFSSPSPSP